MTAPDRVWISADELERQAETFLCSSNSYYADNLGEVEYIRKGAFPVEGARRALNHYDHWRQRTGEGVLADGAIVMYLRSILSLLESDE